MTPIDIFMMLYSLLIGLGIAGLLSGIGELLRSRTPPRWGLLVPLTALVLFVTLLGLFIDSYSQFKGVTMSLKSIGIPALVGVLYYLAAILTVPREGDGWDDLDAYFMARGKLIFGCLFVAYAAVIFGIEIPGRIAEGRPVLADWAYCFGNGIAMAFLLVPVLTRRRWPIVAAMIGELVMLGIIYLPDQRMGDTIRQIVAFVTP